MGMCHISDRRDVEYLDARVAEGLAVDQLGGRFDCSSKRSRVAWVDEGSRDSEAGECEVHHVERSAVQIFRSDDVIAGAQQRSHR